MGDLVSAVVAAVLGAILAAVFLSVALVVVARRYLERKAAELVDAAVANLLPRFRAEVRRGFEEAAEAVLPRVRSEVREGVRDGLGDLKEKILGKTAGSVIDAGLSVLSTISRQKPGE